MIRLPAALALVVLACPAQAGALKIVNKTQFTITAAHVSHGAQFGADHLDGTPIRPGQERTLRWVADGKRRLKLVNQRKEVCVLDGIDFEDGKVLTVTDRVLGLCE